MTADPQVISGYRVGNDRQPEKNPVDKHRPTEAAARALDALHKGVAIHGSNCADAPDEWVDIDREEDIPDEETARLMCADCPVFMLCKTYDETANPSFGVWAGQFRGKEIL